ncbi:hypothetical protein [Micromonospora auratinigra]|uniref:Uncharacterized protein n=1 Tax=Micromonospora auratinigra TaxID=261654 RepID=A0A1A8Z449_9ACTN|nr:hypothetical protein [Micromonospora auratinigra]SBT38704.1 hypothetical protein GA0070611_0645 [Micromonospora auratinigra]
MQFPSSAQSAWLLSIGGVHSVLEFKCRLNRRDDPASAWRLDGGIAASLAGFPALAFGVGIGGISLVQALDPKLDTFRVFRSLPGAGDAWGGHVTAFSFNGWKYVVSSEGSWALTPSEVHPWNLPVSDSFAESDGGPALFGYRLAGWDSGEERGGCSDCLYEDELGTGFRQFWGSTTAAVGAGSRTTTVMGYLTMPIHRSKVNDEGLVEMRGVFSLIRPLDTNWNSFQVWRGVDERDNKYGSGYYEGAYFRRVADVQQIDGISGVSASVGSFTTDRTWVADS